MGVAATFAACLILVGCQSGKTSGAAGDAASRVYVAPGNAGTAVDAENVDIATDDFATAQRQVDDARPIRHQERGRPFPASVLSTVDCQQEMR